MFIVSQIRDNSKQTFSLCCDFCLQASIADCYCYSISLSDCYSISLSILLSLSGSFHIKCSKRVPPTAKQWGRRASKVSRTFADVLGVIACMVSFMLCFSSLSVFWRVLYTMPLPGNVYKRRPKEKIQRGKIRRTRRLSNIPTPSNPRVGKSSIEILPNIYSKMGRGTIMLIPHLFISTKSSPSRANLLL